jgi:2'-5' RNA ligase
MPRYVVVLPLTPLAAGDRFSTRDWPLHVTIVPTFHSTDSASAIAAQLSPAAFAHAPVTLEAGDEERFGTKNTVPVTVIEPTPELFALHRALVASLDHPEFENPEFTGDGYRAHVTVKKYGRVARGQRMLLDQIALVDMQPGQELGMRQVLSVVSLGGGGGIR